MSSSGDSGFDGGMANNANNKNRGHWNAPPQFVQYRDRYVVCNACRRYLYKLQESRMNRKRSKWFQIDQTVVVYDDEGSHSMEMSTM